MPADSEHLARLPSTRLLNATTILSFRCFVAVVQTQSFSAAARQLRLAPSTVTKHVKLVESAVRMALVMRTTRRVSVSDAGARFYEQCVAILAQVDLAADALASEHELRGDLRLTAPPAFVAGALGPRLNQFLALHPGLALDVLVSSDMPDLIRSRIDLALRFGESPLSKLNHLSLMSCALVLCASPAYIAAAGMPKTPADLAAHTCMAARFSERAEGWPIKNGGVWQVVQPSTRLLSNNGELLKQACLDGVGIGCLYEFHARDQLRSGDLVRVLGDYEIRPKTLYAIVANHQIIRPQLKASVEFIKLVCRDIVAGTNCPVPNLADAPGDLD